MEGDRVRCMKSFRFVKKNALTTRQHLRTFRATGFVADAWDDLKQCVWTSAEPTSIQIELYSHDPYRTLAHLFAGLRAVVLGFSGPYLLGAVQASAGRETGDPPNVLSRR